MNKHARQFLGTTAALMLLASPAFADNDKALNDHDRWFRNSMEGSWEVETTVREDAVDCTTSPEVTFGITPFAGLYTFHRGGTISETGSRSPPSRRSPGHGIWERTGRDTYTARNRFQSYDANGLLSNNMDQRTVFTLSRDGNAFSGVSRFFFSDLFGNTFPFCATMEGVRNTL